MEYIATKKILLTAVLVVFCGMLVPFTANAQTSEEHVSDFSASIVIHKDSSLVVTEEITYDFGVLERHGIFRDIPYQYTRNGAKYSLRLDVLSVTDGLGAEQQFSTSRSGGKVSIKIGDPNVFVDGVRHYKIVYKIRRGVNFFDDHDELYWNVTGNEWLVSIKQSSAVVFLPQSIPATDIRHACYTGPNGSAASDCSYDGSTAGVVSFQSDSAFNAGEGLTIVVGLPKGVIKKPPILQSVADFLYDNWYAFIPLIVWALLHRHWYLKGRDPKARQLVIPMYEPPENMSTAVLGSLWDERADLKDISAAIVGMAVKGYVKIAQKGKKDFAFTKLKEEDVGLDAAEKEIFESLFGNRKVGESVEMSDLKNKFYKHLPDIKKAMYESLVQKKYYLHNPDAIRKRYLTVGLVILGISLFLLPGFSGWMVVVGVITGALVCFYGWIMPAKTLFGAEVKEHIQGFKWFLSVTEKERLKFYNPPGRTPEQFEHFLPYAMSLGVEKQWAGQFADIYKAQPEWYEGSGAGVFNAVIFASVMSDMSSNLNSTMSSHPSSAGGGSSGFGGGGFSGGGFGGGGGGSW